MTERTPASPLKILLVAIGLFVVGGGIVAVVALRRPHRGKSIIVPCQNNLKQVCTALNRYMDDNGWKSYPCNILVLVEQGYLDKKLLTCPDDREASRPGAPPTSYSWIFDRTGRRDTRSLGASTPLAWDSKPRHHGGRNILRLDGSVEFIPDADERFEEFIHQFQVRFSTPVNSTPAPARTPVAGH